MTRSEIESLCANARGTMNAKIEMIERLARLEEQVELLSKLIEVLAADI